MEHTPPPFFNRGPAPLVRLAFFASLSLALLVLDARFRYAEGLRERARARRLSAAARRHLPAALGERIAGYFASQSQLRDENDRAAREAAERFAGRATLRGGAGRDRPAAPPDRRRERLPLKATPAEILYHGRDPYSRKVIIDKGSQHGVSPGSAGRRRERRHRPGDARASLVVGSDAAHRQGPGDPGAGGAQRPARGGLRRRRRAACSSCASWRRTPTCRTATSWSPRGSTAPIRPACRSPPWRASSATPPTRSRASSASPLPASSSGSYVLVLGGEAKRLAYPEEASRERDKRPGRIRKARRKDADAAQ